MKKLLASCALIALVTAGFNGGAYAQATPPAAPAPAVPGHPAESEIDQRLQDQQNRTDAGVQNGKINATQEMHDDNRDARVSKEMSRDEAKNGGTLTPKEDAKMNRQLNRNSKHIHKQRHTPATTAAPAQ